ncbi:MAG: hypothetical protein CFH06_01700 [Alphaproteobacteria bacterium MarineAlpha3_Bin5]|nr:efflux transporter periplasmic adaptor subunit [Magnetovibrio sp.]PPR76631.1 MAG: hypothetical protein CFH06_01700 [Alphaproteobacteria bacterium MarineAlpha3_Bin5]
MNQIGLLAGLFLLISDFSLAETHPTRIYAQLKGQQEVILSSELSARIKTIVFREGAYFSKGDILVKFDCALEQAKIEKAMIIVNSLKRTHDIQQRLLKLNSTGNLEVEIAAVNLAKARADMDIQSVIVSKCSLLAPFSGRVVEAKARPHQFVSIGQPLIKIVDYSKIELEFLAPSNWLQWIKPGYPFAIKINETGNTYRGKVTRTGAQIDPVTHSIKIFGELTGDSENLIAGMTGSILIKVGKSP